MVINGKQYKKVTDSSYLALKNDAFKIGALRSLEFFECNALNPLSSFRKTYGEGFTIYKKVTAPRFKTDKPFPFGY